MSVEWEVHGLEELISAVEGAPAKLAKLVGPVVTKGALNIKNDWRRRWSGIGHAPAVPYSITYDIKALGSRLEAEIGPDKSRRQGALGNILEFGTVNNAPRPGGLPALQAEEPKFVQNISELPEKVLGGDG